MLRISLASLHNDFVELDKMQVNIQGIEHEVNKHVALRLRLDSMALRVLLSATILKARSFYFSNFANGSERKGLSAFTGKFPSSTAGLHLVLKVVSEKNHV